MCTKPKISTKTVETIRESKPAEVIRDSTPADASKQKASIETRLNRRGLISDNIKTTNNGVEDEIEASKKKLLGE